MLRVGLTGGIACGKSTVAARLAARGVPIVNDDEAAREAVAPGSDGLAEVVREFGAEVLASDGSLDRPRLGRIVFADDARRRRLMAITHPRIGAILRERFARAERSGAPIVVYESALLIENGAADAWRPLVVVTTRPEIQLERLCRRSGLGRDEALARIRAQLPLERKAALADHVVENSGSVAELERAVDALHRALERQAGLASS